MAFLEKYKSNICKSAIVPYSEGWGEKSCSLSPTFPLQVSYLKMKNLYPVLKLVPLTQLWNEIFNVSF